MDQYKGSYVARLLSLCLPSSCSVSTLLLFLISFFRPGSSISLGFILTLSLSLLVYLSFSLSSFYSLFLCLSLYQSLSLRAWCARSEGEWRCLSIDRIWLSSVYPWIFCLLREMRKKRLRSNDSHSEMRK